MATNIEIKRYSGGSWGTLYPKANWNNMDNKPSTFTPSAHSHTPRSIGVVPIYRYGTQGTTTKIKININSTAYWMLCFTVTLYQSYRATKIMISGYNYGYGGQYWYQPEARILGDSDGNETITVYFGYDSARNLWVGFDGGDYTGVSINDITNGYDQLDHFDELFTISNVSSLSTIQTTITAGSKANYSNNSGKLNGQEASYYLNYNNLTNKPTIPDISGKADKASVTAGWYRRVYVNTQGIVTEGDQTDTDTNTWRPIKINGTTKINDTSTALNFIANGSASVAFDEDTNSVVIGATNSTYNFGGTTFNSGNAGNAEHDANYAVDNGHYYYGSNGPSTSLGASTDDGALYVQSYSSNWVAQIAQDYRNGRLFVRGKNNGTWQSWLRVALTGESQPASDVYAWAKAANKPSYSFSGSAVTSGANSGSAVAAVTAINAGSGGLEGNTTSSGGIPYVEASLNGTELTLTVKYLHHSHTGASVKTTANAAPNSHTHSVTASGSVS